LLCVREVQGVCMAKSVDAIGRSLQEDAPP
jgi:hypothetical protein